MRSTWLTTRRLNAGAVGLACSLALIAGCGGDNEPETLPSESTSQPASESPEPTETATTEPPTDREKAITGAEDAIRDYYGVRGEVAGDPEVRLSRLEEVLIDPALTQVRDYFERFRDQGFSSMGTIKVDSMKVRRVDLFPKKSQGSISMRVCYNLEDVVTLDADNKPVDPISPGLVTFEVYNFDYPSDAGWVVAVENVAAKGCTS